MSNVKRFFFKDFDEFVRKFRCKFFFDIGENSKFYFFKILIGYKFDLFVVYLKIILIKLN